MLCKLQHDNITSEVTNTRLLICLFTNTNVHMYCFPILQRFNMENMLLLCDGVLIIAIRQVHFMTNVVYCRHSKYRSLFSVFRHIGHMVSVPIFL